MPSQSRRLVHATIRLPPRFSGIAEEERVVDDLKKGDEVTWNSHGSTANGHVERKVTSDIKIKDHQVRASRDDPQYLVKSDKGGEAAHKPDALKKA
jgi:hypothetical protein